MTTLDGFLQKIIADPLNAEPVWLVLADWLEEQGDPRFEFVRLMHQPGYRLDLSLFQRDERVRELLASGMQPVVPTIENSIGMRFALIPAGTFLMGSPDSEGDDDEHPRHEVEITRPFWMGVHLVRQEQYQRLMGNNPSYFCSSGDGKEQVRDLDTTRLPVERVSWEETVKFCKVLSKLQEEKHARRAYHLPTEAEWEYACRGGAACYVPFHFGHSVSSTQANFANSNLQRTCPVESYPANAFGLFDMHGNVWEWCLDWFGEGYYKTSSKCDPHGPQYGDGRVCRGGSWISGADCSRVTYRNWHDPDSCQNYLGLRACFSLS